MDPASKPILSPPEAKRQFWPVSGLEIPEKAIFLWKSRFLLKEMWFFLKMKPFFLKEK